MNIIKKITKWLVTYFHRPVIGNFYKAPILMIASDCNRTLTLNSKKFAPQLDSFRSILEDKGFNVQSASWPGSFVSQNDCYYYSVLFNNFYFAKNYIINVMVKMKIIDSPMKIFAKWVVEQLGIRVLICILADHNLGLVREFRKIGVIICELSHGIGMPSNGSNYFLDRNGEQWFDVYIAFDLVTQKSGLKNLQKSKIYIIKNPYIHFFEKKNVAFFTLELNNIRNLKKKFTKFVLVTFSWGYIGDFSDYNGIIKNGLFFDELFDTIDLRTDVMFVLRLHPYQLSSSNNVYENQVNYVKKLSEIKRNVLTFNESHLPLPILLPSIDLHITLASSTCYECSYFGIKSLVLCPSARKGTFPNVDNVQGYKANELFGDLIKSGFVCKSESSFSVINEFIDQQTKQTSNKIEIGNNDFYEFLTRCLEV